MDTHQISLVYELGLIRPGAPGRGKEVELG